MADGKVSSFYGSLSGSSGGVIALNALSGSVSLAGAHGVTLVASGATITIDTPQDLRASASPLFAGMLISSTAGSPGVVSALTPATGFTYALDVKGPIRAQAGIISFETANPTGDPTNYSALIYNKTLYGPVISGSQFAVMTGGSGSTPTTNALTIDSSGHTILVVSLATPLATVGSASQLKQSFSVQSAGSQDNVHDYSPAQALLGPACTTAQSLDTHIHAVTSIGSREAALRVGAINPNSTANTNWETDGISSVVVNYNPPQTNSGYGYPQQGNTVVAGSFMAIGAAAGSATFGLNTLVRDYDNEVWGSGQHWACTLIGAEMDMSIADTGTSAAGINMNIEWKNGKPTPLSTGFTLQQAGTSGSTGAYFDYGFWATDYATNNALSIGLKGGTSTGETAHIELLSGTGTRHFNHIYGSAAGGFTLWPDLTHNSNQITIDASANTIFPANVTVTGTLIASVAVNPGLKLPKVGGTLNSISRGLAAIVAESTSVAAFGVVGDGVTNDQAAMQIAVNTIVVNGGWLRIPGGMSVRIVGSVSIPSGLKLIGDGYQLSQILSGGSIPSGYGLLDFPANTTNVTIVGIQIEGLTGNNVTSALAGTASVTYADSGNPYDSQWTNSSSIWIHPGCSNITLEEVNVNHTAGYALFANAVGAFGTIRQLTLRKCTFTNCRMAIGGTTGDINYGTYGSGVLLYNDGVYAYFDEVLVEQCFWNRSAGYGFWTHIGSVSNLDYFNRDLTFTDNRGRDTVPDLLMIAGWIGARVTNNYSARNGYLCLDDADSTRMPRWNASVVPVAFDSAGLNFNVTLDHNIADCCNGEMYDADGIGEATYSNSTFISSFVADDPYADSSSFPCGPGGNRQNWTRFLNTGNSYNLNSRIGTYIIVTGNESYGAGGGFATLNGAQSCKITDNLIYVPPVPYSNPIVLANYSWQHSGDNDISGNSFHLDPSSTVAIPAITESDYLNGTYVPFTTSDSNRVWKNDTSYLGTHIGAGLYEFSKSVYSASQVKYFSIPSSSSLALGIVETHILTSGTQTSNYQCQIWSNSSAGTTVDSYGHTVGQSPTGSQLLTLTPAAAFVPALGIGSTGVIDASRNFTGNSLTVSTTPNPTVFLKDVNPLGGGLASIFAYTYAGFTTQTVPSATYSMVDSSGYGGAHVFSTQNGAATFGTPNTAVVERLRIYADGHINFNGDVTSGSPNYGIALQVNGGTVINTSGQWVGGIASASASFTSLTVGSGGATFSSPTYFVYGSNYSINASSINVTNLSANGALAIDSSGNGYLFSLAINGAQVLNSSRQLVNVTGVVSSGGVQATGFNPGSSFGSTINVGVFISGGIAYFYNRAVGTGTLFNQMTMQCGVIVGLA